ncbi:MAG: acetate--CoA ligase family protein [Anaerolineae bacterium]|nr:acetate--CoA ligase family protein [Anaerolineae bacterium]
MVKLHEVQAKGLLAAQGIAVPSGIAVNTAAEAGAFAAGLGAPVVVKAQVFTTSRAGQGLIRFAGSPTEAREAAAALIGQRFGKFAVEQVLVEEQVEIAHEYYLGLIIDSKRKAPVLLFSRAGGSGIEGRAESTVRHEIDVLRGLSEAEALEMCRQAGVEPDQQAAVAGAMLRFYAAARGCDARSAEINPLVNTIGGEVVALDARFSIDDYSVFRHPELGIEIAREFDHPPTALEKIAWQVEKDDYRGTFYFIQMLEGFEKGAGVIGFHGAGGGGSMMNMDALLKQGFQVANFVDTSGNPPASKVYRAARIILSQPNIDGYFAGGSGVASQEQYHSARGLVKAFMDAPLHVPAVIRIGGNREEEAITILRRANGVCPAPVEAYGRDDSPDTCADRLRALISSYQPVEPPAPPIISPAQEPYTFETVTGGTITFDHALCRDCQSKVCVQTCVPQILSVVDGVPTLNISREDARKGGCIECLACEVECRFLGSRGGFIRLPIPGLESEDEYVHFD